LIYIPNATHDKPLKKTLVFSNNHEYAHLPVAHEGTDPADAFLPAMTMPRVDAKGSFHNMRTSATAPMPAVLEPGSDESMTESPTPSKPKKVFEKEGRYSINKDLETKVTRDDLDTDNDDNDNDLSDGESDDEYRNLLHKEA
jgi:hypothetical protein